MNNKTPIVGNAIDLLVDNHLDTVGRRLDDFLQAIQHAKRENVRFDVAPDYSFIRAWYQSEAKER